MQVQAFSCARPLPEHMGRMCVPATSAELDALIAEGAYTQDLGRCLYLVARRDDELVRRGIVCCGEVDELAAMVATKDGLGNAPQVDESEDEDGPLDTPGSKGSLEKARALGAHAEAVVCEYETSYALDVIVAAAQSATPLYNLSNGSGTQVVVWRVSREDAVQAICAVLATTPCEPAAESAGAVAAAKALADEAREKRPNLDARSAVLHPLCLLVPAGQDMSTPLLPSNGLLMHRFA